MHIAQMTVDNSQRGFVRPLPGQHTKARQARALRDAGLTRHYVIGEAGVESWRDVVRHMREGYVLAVEGLALLPDPKSKNNPAPSHDMRDAIEAIEKAGASIFETHTGRSTLDPEQRQIMIRLAVKALGAGSRALPSDVARANALKRGKRANNWDQWRDIIEREWDSRKHMTIAAAVAAMKAKGLPPKTSSVTVWRLITAWRGKGNGGRDVAAGD